MRVLRLTPLLLTGLNACALMRPPLPELGPGVTREMPDVRSESCRGSSCTTIVALGAARFRLASHADAMSPDEALGRPRGSLGARAVSALGESLVRRIGGTTTEHVVSLGTRAVSDSTGELRLECETVWIDELSRERENGEDRTRTARIAEGIACQAVATVDSAVRWRFRRGLAPARDSLAPLLESLTGLGASRTRGGDAIVLERVTAGGARRYVVDRGPDQASGPFVLPQAHLVLRRDDGTLVGALHEGMGATTAVDVAPGADAEETMLLRMLGVCLVRPFAAS